MRPTDQQTDRLARHAPWTGASKHGDRYAPRVPEDWTDEEIAEGYRLLVERVRSMRQEAGLSMRELADRSGLSYDSLRSVESHRRLPSLATLAKLADAMGTTLRDLLAGIYPWDGPRPPR